MAKNRKNRKDIVIPITGTAPVILTPVAAGTATEQEAILAQLDAEFAVPRLVGTAISLQDTEGDRDVVEPEPKRRSRKAKPTLVEPNGQLTDEMLAILATPASQMVLVNVAADAIAALFPTGQPVRSPVALGSLRLLEAIAVLSRPVQVGSLPPGSHFSLSGRFGTFLEAAGQDAKVEWDGKVSYWSAATEVRWAAELPTGAASKTQPKMPVAIAALNRTPELAAPSKQSSSVALIQAPVALVAPKAKTPKVVRPDGLLPQQVRILAALVTAKRPLSRKEISASAVVDLPLLTSWIGSTDDAIRAKNDTKVCMSLLTLGAVSLVLVEGAGMHYSITAKGHQFLAAPQ